MCRKKPLVILHVLYKNSFTLNHAPNYKNSRRKIKENLCELRLGNYFFNVMPKAQFIKKGKLDFIKIKNICSPEDSGRGLGDSFFKSQI